MRHADSLSVHLGAYVQADDPSLDANNRVAAKKLWVDNSNSENILLKVRNETNDDWLVVAGGSSGSGGSLPPGDLNGSTNKLEKIQDTIIEITPTGSQTDLLCYSSGTGQLSLKPSSELSTLLGISTGEGDVEMSSNRVKAINGRQVENAPRSTNPANVFNFGTVEDNFAVTITDIGFTQITGGYLTVGNGKQLSAGATYVTTKKSFRLGAADNNIVGFVTSLLERIITDTSTIDRTKYAYVRLRGKGSPYYTEFRFCSMNGVFDVEAFGINGFGEFKIGDTQTFVPAGGQFRWIRGDMYISMQYFDTVAGDWAYFDSVETDYIDQDLILEIGVKVGDQIGYQIRIDELNSTALTNDALSLHSLLWVDEYGGYAHVSLADLKTALNSLP